MFSLAAIARANLGKIFVKFYGLEWVAIAQHALRYARPILGNIFAKRMQVCKRSVALRNSCNNVNASNRVGF